MTVTISVDDVEWIQPMTPDEIQALREANQTSSLSFTYGTMFAGKSAMALQMANHLEHANIGVLLLTFGDRRGTGVVSSRIGIEMPAYSITEPHRFSEIRQDAIAKGVKVLIVDEAQFATAQQIDELALMVDKYQIDVHCFGLATDFRLQLFEGSARLFELADTIRELPLAAYCWCGKKGKANARFVNGEIQREGTTKWIDSEDAEGLSYAVLCRYHYLTSRGAN